MDGDPARGPVVLRGLACPSLPVWLCTVLEVVSACPQCHPVGAALLLHPQLSLSGGDRPVTSSPATDSVTPRISRDAWEGSVSATLCVKGRTPPKGSVSITGATVPHWDLHSLSGAGHTFTFSFPKDASS